MSFVIQVRSFLRHHMTLLSRVWYSEALIYLPHLGNCHTYPAIDLHFSFTLVGEHSFRDWLRVFHVPYREECSRCVWNQYVLIHWKGYIYNTAVKLNKCKSLILYLDFFCVFVLATIESGTQKSNYKTVTFMMSMFYHNEMPLSVSSDTFLISIFVLY